jgi:hypothetical protein
MLRLFGSTWRTCDGLSPRDLPHVGVSVYQARQWDKPSDCSRTRSIPRRWPPGYGRAKLGIRLSLFVTAPQHETLDPKPRAARQG